MVTAPMIHVPFPLGASLAEHMTALRDFGLAYPEHRANIIQHCADLQNWFSGQLPGAGNSETN
jgi:hypothetical protein